VTVIYTSEGAMQTDVERGADMGEDRGVLTRESNEFGHRDERDRSSTAASSTRRRRDRSTEQQHDDHET